MDRIEKPKNMISIMKEISKSFIPTEESWLGITTYIDIECWQDIFSFEKYGLPRRAIFHVRNSQVILSSKNTVTWPPG